MKNKIYNYLKNVFFRTPDLDYLKQTQDTKKRKKYLIYWLNKAYKNQSFKNYFFFKKEPTKVENINFRYQSNENFKITDQMCESLKMCGILVIENALPKNEKMKIIEYFESLKKNDHKKYWINKPKKIEGRNDTSLITASININNLNYLMSYSDQITKLVYNKVVKPNTDIYHLKIGENCNEELIRGETFLHTDRFLPHLKIFYTPFEINNDGAPLEYALGSHNINNEYINFFINSKNFDETDIDSNKLYKSKVKITTTDNTLYIAFTNGLHRRTDFKVPNSERHMMYLQYVKNFNKLNYYLNM